MANNRNKMTFTDKLLVSLIGLVVSGWFLTLTGLMVLQRYYHSKGHSHEYLSKGYMHYLKLRDETAMLSLDILIATFKVLMVVIAVLVVLTIIHAIGQKGGRKSR